MVSGAVRACHALSMGSDPPDTRLIASVSTALLLLTCSQDFLLSSVNRMRYKRAPTGPENGAVHKECASSTASDGAPRQPSGVLVLGHRREPAGGATPGGCHALYLRPQAWCGVGHAERIFGASAPCGAGGVCALRLTQCAGGVGGRAAGDRGSLGTAARELRCTRSLARWMKRSWNA